MNDLKSVPVNLFLAHYLIDIGRRAEKLRQQFQNRRRQRDAIQEAYRCGAQFSWLPRALIPS